MGKWLFRKDSPRVDATPDYKCKEILLPEKIEKTAKELYEEWLDGYIASGGEVKTHNWYWNDPYTNQPYYYLCDYTAQKFESKYFHIVKEDGVLPAENSWEHCYIILPGVFVHIPEECEARVFNMEDFSFRARGETSTPVVFKDYPSYEIILEKLTAESKAKKGAKEAKKKADRDKEQKEFNSFMKKTKSTRELSVAVEIHPNCPEKILISHLPKKTTICSGDKNYSMTIYVTPQAYLKIEKDTGTGTIITVSNEVAAALVGDKKDA